ncbi:MAG: hypothetical protein GF404_04415 [candidate division Zixibacteria bacterium]|nr:hypothetical protein [candidate division Zixibacteria bacterium]
MQKIFMVVFFILVFAVGLMADSEGFRGPDRISANPTVTIHEKDDNGVTSFVRGQLSETRATRGQEAQVAFEFFEANRGAFNMNSPSEELSVKRMDVDEIGMRHLRLTQNYQGLKVIGGEMIAHFAPDGELRVVNGNYEPVKNLDARPNLDPTQATRIATDDLAGFFGEGKPDDPELVVFPWEGEYHLSWRMFVYSDSPMGRWEYFVDARTGAVIFKANRIMDANDIGTGTGVMGNTFNHLDTDYNGSVYEMIDYTRQLNNNPHGHNGQMPDGNYIQTNVAGSSLPGSIATDADNVWNESSHAPAVSGHAYTSMVYDYLLNEFNRNSYDNNGASMLTIVNYSGDGDNNAYWDGSRIVIWSWSSGWRSLAGCPDVIAHEWGHAVTEYTSGLVYQKEPGALNEAFSDMIGAAFEWAHDSIDTPDWDMGENGRESGVPFRSMSEPHDFSDPDTYGTSDPYWIDVVGCSPSWLNDYCGVHTNSGVGNKWFFLLSDGGTHNGVTVTGIGVENAMQVAYRANAFYWTSTTDYHEGALGTISAALDLDAAWTNAVADAWNAVNVSTPGPSLVFDYPNGVPESVMPNQSESFEVEISGILGGSVVAGSPTLHYSIDGGLFNTTPMTYLFDDLYSASLPSAECDSRIDFYVSADETTSGTFNDPDPSTPHSALVATEITSVIVDDFESDLGWTVSGDASDGQWNRGTPVGGGDRGDPPNDYDGSGQCYLTDNVDGNSDVDGGTTILTSPGFDLSAGDGLIHYARWYSNHSGADPNNDEMYVYISANGGANWTLVETIGPVDEASGGWYEVDFWASDYVVPSNQMRVKFEVSDLGSGSVVEAGLDDFWVKTYECYDSGLVIVTDNLPDWTVGRQYDKQLESAGSTGNVVWSDKNGDLIGTGLQLNSDGLLTGIPSSTGQITFTAMVEDDAPSSDEKLFTFNINPSLEIQTATLPDWTVNQPYSQQVVATGGTAPIVFSDLNGDLAGTGLSLSGSGEISGTPNTSGLLEFSVMAYDAAGDSDMQSYSITINPAIQVTTQSLPDWTIGHAYTQQVEAVGGTGQLTFIDQNLGLDGTGLSISASGEISGTPSASGPISLIVRVSDEATDTEDKQFDFTINTAVAITTDSLIDAEQNSAYNMQLASTGGTSPLIWSDKNNDLDGSGLTLSSEGLLSGTPVIYGDMSFTAHVADDVGSFDEKVFDLHIEQSYICGDANADGLVNVTDAVLIVNFAFGGGVAPDPEESGEVNCDGIVDVSDAIYIINYAFIQGSPAPCECGLMTAPMK